MHDAFLSLCFAVGACSGSRLFACPIKSGMRHSPRKSQYDISLEKYWTDPIAYKDRHFTSILSSKDQIETSGYEGGGR